MYAKPSAEPKTDLFWCRDLTRRSGVDIDAIRVIVSCQDVSYPEFDFDTDKEKGERIFYATINKRISEGKKLADTKKKKGGTKKPTSITGTRG